MPLSVALGRGPAAWVDVCGGATSRVEDVVPIGYRDPDEVPTFEQIAPELGPAFRPVSKDEVQAEGPTAVGERVAADLASGAGRFWMHLDVDILGEDEFPATDYLMPDGLDMDELVALMRPLAASPALIGAVDRLLQPGEGSGRRVRARAGRRVPRDARALAPEPLPRLRDRLDVGHPLACAGGADGERGGQDRVPDGRREFGAHRETGGEHAVEAVARAGRVDHRDARSAGPLHRTHRAGGSPHPRHRGSR